MNDKILTFSSLSIIILILIFGLWLLKLNPINQVFWLSGEPGVRITGPGHLYSPDSLSDFFLERQISLECLLRPAVEPGDRLPVILSLGDGRRREVFLVGQWRDSPAIRVRISRADVPRGYRERGKKQVLKKGRTVLLTLTSSPAGTALYQDGVRAADWPGFPLLDDGPVGRSVLVLGNSPRGQSHWEGDLLGLACYNRVLTDREVRENHSHWIRGDYRPLTSGPGLIGLFPFTEGQGDRVRNLMDPARPLWKPAVFHPRQKVVLEGVTREQWGRWNFYQDLTVNLLGFIPLGCFTALRLRRFPRLPLAGVWGLPLLLGALLSLGIELTQVYLPNRDSQTSDLICNTLGTLIGAALAGGVGKKMEDRRWKMEETARMRDF